VTGQAPRRRRTTGLGRVQIDQAAHPLGGAVGDARDDHAAVAVADQDHLAQVVVVQLDGDVADVADV